MVVYDFNIRKPVVGPSETNAKLIVDPDAVLPLAKNNSHRRWANRIINVVYGTYHVLVSCPIGIAAQMPDVPRSKYWRYHAHFTAIPG
jgi:hypothetical protein